MEVFFFKQIKTDRPNKEKYFSKIKNS